MHLEGKFSVRGSQTEVYQFLTDARTVSKHMPDVQEVDFLDDDHFTVKAKVGISHIKGMMVMKLAISDRNPPVSTTVTGKGTGLGSNVDMITSFTLEGGAGGTTIVNWRGDVNVAGKLAAFGPQGLLDRVGQQNVDRFIAGIKAGIDDAYGGPVAQPEPEPVAAPEPAALATPSPRGFLAAFFAWLRGLFRRRANPV